MSGGVAATRMRAGFYLDSVALMRISGEIEGLAGIAAASLMMGSSSTKALLRDAGLLDEAGGEAGPNDLLIAIRAEDGEALHAAFDAAEAALAGPSGGGGRRERWNHYLHGAVRQHHNPAFNP